MTVLERQGELAKSAGRTLAIAGSARKNAALEAIAKALAEKQDVWLCANAEDVAAAKETGMRPAMLDRLTLTQERIAGIVDGIRQVAALPDPIGTVTKMETRPNGLIIGRRRVPLGVIAIIYEARPNVTVDAAALCLKSGNACILRGGKEAIRSNRAVVELMRGALESAGLPADCISLVQDTSHESANELMHLTAYVDVLIPRGGANLIRSVAKNASVPVIRTGEGVCHVYIDSEADLDMGARILYNAKCSRPSVCNATECVLVAQDIAADFFQKAVPLLKTKNVELRCDKAALALVGGDGIAAQESDWDAEYDDYILAVHVVKNAAEAIDFINAHGTGHSESIITKNYFTAQHFLDAVDAAAVYVNASTRFTDGGEFGLGAEIGISTQKMHARGPMGLEELTSCKYVIYGEGQIRE
ncbi:glutamate-5-semialdehyde dehydrogenase [Oscillibacter sp.]|uniref:glutamate-5-semialdehyde dehydrogenase n=1 Tax=Oscillibacter sp. TaxID=1945593 RepID=UPI003391AE83